MSDKLRLQYALKQWWGFRHSPQIREHVHILIDALREFE
jgi:hypothetical protein